MNDLNEDNVRQYLMSLPPNSRRRIYNLSSKDLDYFSTKLEEIKKVENKGNGKLLEDFISDYFRKLNLHTILTNKKTSTNEYDVFLLSNERTRDTLNIINPFLIDNFIIECKNYNKRLSVTWAGKFYSLLKRHNIKFGIIVTINQFSGRNNWHATKGFCSKVALKENLYIINFHLQDLEKLAEGLNIFDLIDRKLTLLKDEIDYSSDIDDHELQNDASIGFD